MAKTALITGVSGQDGAYLSRILIEKGYKVIGGDHRKIGGNHRLDSGSLWRLKELGIADEVELTDFELGEPTNIYKAIEKSNHRKIELNKIPYWYLRIAAKQVIMRDIKLSNLIKTIFQFNEIYKIIENANFQKKLLIIFESIVNVLWYSFISVLKPKK